MCSPQCDVHDLGEIHLEDGQEQFHARAADVEIIHRRKADNRRRINRVLAMRDGGDVKYGQSAARNLGLRAGIPLGFSDDALSGFWVFAVVRLAEFANDQFLPPNFVSSPLGILLEVIISLPKVAVNSCHSFLD